MNVFLIAIIILICLIIGGALTMYLHQNRIINLYTSTFEKVLTFGSYIFATLIIIIPVILAQSEDTAEMYAAIAFGIATIILAIQSIRINSDIKSVIIAIIGNITWAIIGALLSVLTLFLLAFIFGGNNSSSKKNSNSSDIFSIFSK